MFRYSSLVPSTLPIPVPVMGKNGTVVGKQIRNIKNVVEKKGRESEEISRKVIPFRQCECTMIALKDKRKTAGRGK